MSSPKQNKDGWFKPGKRSGKRKAGSPLGKHEAKSRDIHHRDSGRSDQYSTTSACDPVVSTSSILSAANEVLYGDPSDAVTDSSYTMDIREQVAETNRKLDFIVNKLAKLDTIGIESHMTQLTVKVQKIDSDVQIVNTRLRDVEKSSQFLADTFEEHRAKIEGTAKTVNTLKDDFEKLKVANDQLKANMLDIQARSMRENLLFFGLAETHNEDCSAQILEFCETELKITKEEASAIEIDRAHRLGRRNIGVNARPRPIVCKFHNYATKETIRMKGHMLKDTRFGVSEQYPREIQESRRLLMPVMHRARANGRTVRLVQDRLYIDGTLYDPSRPR
jgi:hypothetical protein